LDTTVVEKLSQVIFSGRSLLSPIPADPKYLQGVSLTGRFSNTSSEGNVFHTFHSGRISKEYLSVLLHTIRMLRIQLDCFMFFIP